MFRFCSCDGISASRNVSKSALVNAGGGLGCGATAGSFAGGGEGNDSNGDGAGPCAWAIAIIATIAAQLEISFCIAVEFASWCTTDKTLIYAAFSFANRDRIISIRFCNFSKCEPDQ